MSHDALNDRRQALEEQFFKNHDEELIQKMKQGAQRATAREEIHALTGISNAQVLQALANLNIGGGAAVLVMSLFPVIEVAWADGEVDVRERTVVLELAATLGLKPGSAGFAYLSQWLDEKPQPAWHTLWASYVRELVALMKDEDRALLKHTILGRARVVAEVSGGFLGTLWRVSDAEKSALERLEQAFG